MDDCIFCKIVRGEVPSYKVYEDEHTLALLDIFPACEYHTLVIPKKHCVNMFDIPPETAAHVMHTVKKVVALYESKLGLNDVHLVSNSGAKAGQTVFHLHFHIVPYFNDSKLPIPWPEHVELREKFPKMLEGLK